MNNVFMPLLLRRDHVKVVASRLSSDCVYFLLTTSAFSCAAKDLLFDELYDCIIQVRIATITTMAAVASVFIIMPMPPLVLLRLGSL